MITSELPPSPEASEDKPKTLCLACPAKLHAKHGPAEALMQFERRWELRERTQDGITKWYNFVMPEGGGRLDEIYRLTKENNKMLRAMRRDVLLGRFFKLLLYAAIAGAMIWTYLTYVAPLLSQMLNTLTQIQAAGSEAQSQMTDWQQTIESLRSKIPGLSSGSAE